MILKLLKKDRIKLEAILNRCLTYAPDLHDDCVMFINKVSKDKTPHKEDKIYRV